MARSRYDRIHERKIQIGVEDGANPGGGQMGEGIPQFRSVNNHSTGKKDLTQYVSDGSNVYKNNYTLVGDTSKDLYTSVWAITDEVDISSTLSQTPLYEIKQDTFVMGVSIWVTSAITAGSLSLDVGDGSNVSLFVTDWDATDESDVVNNILSLGRAKNAGTSEAGESTGKYYGSVDTIDIRIAAGASAGKIRLIINMLQKS